MRTRRAGWVPVALVLALPAPGLAQGLAQRVERVGTATARITYATRPNVEFCRDGIRMRSGADEAGWDEGYEGTPCRSGPAHVELRVDEGRVRGVRVLRPDMKPTRGAVDLGVVPAPAAALYLLSVARTAPERAARTAIFGAVLADADSTPFLKGLVALARDRTLPKRVRTGALFWLGQEAAKEVTRDLADVAADSDEEQSVRNAAIFALSQRPAAEGVPILMELARTAPQAATRRKAMFWLAQSDDPSVPRFFEKILLGGSGR